METGFKTSFSFSEVGNYTLSAVGDTFGVANETIEITELGTNVSVSLSLESEVVGIPVEVYIWNHNEAQDGIICVDYVVV
jgi:hypothetical protein